VSLSVERIVSEYAMVRIWPVVGTAFLPTKSSQAALRAVGAKRGDVPALASPYS
jgi:hypothetical protein